jgi:hypothetical protein
MIAGYVQPISTRQAKRLRATFGGRARSWNRWDSGQRYDFLTRYYEGDNVTSKFSLQKWNQLPVGLRFFIAARFSGVVPQ